LFESYIFHELKCYRDHRRPSATIKFWRTTTGHEVDFIFADQVAIEVKAKEIIGEKDLAAIRICEQEKILKKYVIVSLEERARVVDNGIQILPYKSFLQALWNDEFLEPEDPI
jgi:uncharacterized protein